VSQVRFIIEIIHCVNKTFYSNNDGHHNKKKLSGISTYMICDKVYDESFYGSIILIRRCDVYLLFFMGRNKYEYFST
jgi:hypothetical protein